MIGYADAHDLIWGAILTIVGLIGFVHNAWRNRGW
jgi:hypothetical protein